MSLTSGSIDWYNVSLFAILYKVFVLSVFSRIKVRDSVTLLRGFIIIKDTSFSLSLSLSLSLSFSLCVCTTKTFTKTTA